MRKVITKILVILVFAFLLCACTKKENKEADMFYGETEKWVVIGNIDNTFEFIYKGNINDLKNNNKSYNISFFYGTSLGTTGDTQSLANSNYFEQKFINDFIKGLENDKSVNVQISYSNTRDSIDLVPYDRLKTGQEDK